MDWKDDANCAVLLTFDVDGKQMWRGRIERGLDGFDKPPVLSMGEYGTNVAVPRILDLLAEYDLPAGFFIPGKIAEENPEMVRQIAADGHEIAHHSYAHTNPTTMTDAEEQADFERRIRSLRSSSARPPSAIDHRRAISPTGRSNGWSTWALSTSPP